MPIKLNKEDTSTIASIFTAHDGLRQKMYLDKSEKAVVASIAERNHCTSSYLLATFRQKHGSKRIVKRPSKNDASAPANWNFCPKCGCKLNH